MLDRLVLFGSISENGFILVPTLAQTIGKAAPGWRDIGMALVGSAALALLVVSGWGWLLLPLSLIIASGVLLVVALTNHLVLSELDLFGKRLPAQRTWFVAAFAVSLAVGELLGRVRQFISECQILVARLSIPGISYVKLR